MPRRKPTKPDPELVENDIEQDAKPVKKIVDAKHTITYNAPVTVPVEESEDDQTDENFDEFEIEDKRPKRKTKTSKDERDQLRSDLQKSNITPSSNVRVHIFKFDLENDPIGGAAADKSFCAKIFTTKDAVLNGQHLDTAQRYGPGRYWFILYLDNKVVTAWEERISAPMMSGQIGTINGQLGTNGNQQFISVPDPANPQVTIQMPAGQPLPPQKTFKQELREMAETFKLMQELNGNSNQQQQQNPQPQLSPETSVAEFLMKDPHHAKKIVSNLVGGEGEKDLVALAFEHGPAIIESLGSAIRNILSDFRGSNGTAQMVQAPHANNGQAHNQQQNHGQTGQIQAIQETNRQALEGSHQASPENMASIRPEDELFSRVLDFCRRRTPPVIAAQEIVTFANTVEENQPVMVPDYGIVRTYPIGSSVWPYIEMFGEAPVDEALAFVSETSEIAKEIVVMPHAKQWATQLQVELKKAYEPGEGNGQS